MKPASASQLLAVAAAFCAVVLFGACSSTEKWRRQEIGTEWEKRTKSKATRAMDQINAAADGDDSQGYMANEFDQGKDVKTKSNLFGKKYAKSKKFRTKEFAGADEYKSDNYHFLKRQDYKEKTSRDQKQRFADGNTTAPDAKKKSFWQRRKARTKEYSDNGKLAPVNGYRDTDAEIKRLEGRDLTIVDDAARDDGASLSVGDVRTMLHGPEE